MKKSVQLILDEEEIIELIRVLLDEDFELIYKKKRPDDQAAEKALMERRAP